MLIGAENRMKQTRKQHAPSDTKRQLNSQILMQPNPQSIMFIGGGKQNETEKEMTRAKRNQRATRYLNSHATNS